MLDELDRIFFEHAEAGHVTIEYDTELYLGRLTDEVGTSGSLP